MRDEQRCKTCAFWVGGYLDKQRTRLLERGFCNRHLQNHPEYSGKVKLLGPEWERTTIVTAHDFGCTEWRKWEPQAEDEKS